MKQSESIARLAAAMAKAQGKFRPIKKNQGADYPAKGGRMQYDWADLAAVLAAVRPGLSKNAIALFTPVQVHAAGDTPYVTATILLVHESGEWLSEDFSVPLLDVMDARSVGSASTYARRYGVLALLGLSPMEDDDDGEQARGGDYEQAQAPAQRQAQQGQRTAPRQEAARQVTREPEVQPVVDEQAQARAQQSAKALTRSAETMQIVNDAIASGIKREDLMTWASKILERPVTSSNDWSDEDLQILKDENRARRETVGKSIPGAGQVPKAKLSPKGPIVDTVRKSIPVTDRDGTTHTASTEAPV